MNIAQCSEEVFWAEHANLNAKQLDSIEQLRSLLREEALLDLEDAPCEHTALCRFLKARKWDPRKALEMWQAMVKWRESPAACPADPPFSDSEVLVVKKLYPHFYHKTDLFGRPVYYELLGNLQMTELVKQVGLERVVKLHVQGWDNLRKNILPACSEKAGRQVFTCVAVIDLQGMQLKDFTRDVREFVSRVSAIGQNFFPEHLGQMFLVNAPFVFKTVWSVVKPWLEARTQKKIQVITGPDTSQVLMQVIPKENLIKRLGGESDCDHINSVGPWSDWSCQPNLGPGNFRGSAESSLTAFNMSTDVDAY